MGGWALKSVSTLGIYPRLLGCPAHSYREWAILFTGIEGKRKQESGEERRRRKGRRM
jgi:hypothetical protein